MKIGLFGGSFDPAHAGHLHVAETAAKHLGLDKVWWLATPQNPLKPQSSPLAARIASAKKFARGPKMVVTDLESRLGVRYSIDTVRALKRLYPGVRFTFIMGADSLAQFPRWRCARALAQSLPFAIVSRPGARLHAPLPRHWHYIVARYHPQSSTRLRQRAVAGGPEQC